MKAPDMERKPRKLSHRAIAGIILGTLALMVLATWWVIRASADRAWAEMERRVHSLLTEARSRSSARPALRGTAQPGSAWVDYEDAVSLFGANRAGAHEAYGFFTRSPGGDRASVLKQVAAHAKAIEGLRQGTRRAEGA